MDSRFFFESVRMVVEQCSYITSRSENLGITSLRGIFPRLFTRFPANFLHISRNFTYFAAKLCMGLIAFVNIITTFIEMGTKKIRKIFYMHNFFS